MEEFFQKMEQLEELEEKEKERMIKLLFDAELDLAYWAIEDLAEKIQKERGITFEEAKIRAEQLINSIILDEFDKNEE